MINIDSFVNLPSELIQHTTVSFFSNGSESEPRFIFGLGDYASFIFADKFNLRIDRREGAEAEARFSAQLINKSKAPLQGDKLICPKLTLGKVFNAADVSITLTRSAEGQPEIMETASSVPLQFTSQGEALKLNLRTAQASLDLFLEASQWPVILTVFSEQEALVVQLSFNQLKRQEPGEAINFPAFVLEATQIPGKTAG